MDAAWIIQHKQWPGLTDASTLFIDGLISGCTAAPQWRTRITDFKKSGEIVLFSNNVTLTFFPSFYLHTRDSSSSSLLALFFYTYSGFDIYLSINPSRLTHFSFYSKLPVSLPANFLWVFYFSSYYILVLNSTFVPTYSELYISLCITFSDIPPFLLQIVRFIFHCSLAP